MIPWSTSFIPVRLRWSESAFLARTASQGFFWTHCWRSANARQFLYTRTLLLCEAGPQGPAWKVADISEAMGVTSRCIEHLKKRFVEEGLAATLERKPFEYYLGLKYPVTIHAAPEGGYVAEIEDLPGCLAQGETLAEAYELIEESRRMWLESAYEDGLDIPEPGSQEEYSGKFNVRVPKSLHRKLNRMAEKEGGSLNQFIVFALSHAVGQEEGRQARLRKTKAR